MFSRALTAPRTPWISGVGLTPAGWAIGEAMADAARAKREKKVAFILNDVFG